MNRLSGIAAALILLGASVPSASAQAPNARRATNSPNPSAYRPAARTNVQAPRTYYGRTVVDQNGRYARAPHHATYGFRNPGGVGRYPEYYPPGDRFQNEGSPVHVAQFGNVAGVPNRTQQLQAQQVGIQRNNALQQQMNALGAPLAGFGWGLGAFGAFGGFGFGAPAIVAPVR
jgi:hypothetical protein